MSQELKSVKLLKNYEDALAKFSLGSDQQYRAAQELVDDYFTLRFNIAGATEVVPQIVNVFDGTGADLITSGSVSFGEIQAFNAFVVDNESSVTIPNGIQVFIV